MGPCPGSWPKNGSGPGPGPTSAAIFGSGTRAQAQAHGFQKNLKHDPVFQNQFIDRVGHRPPERDGPSPTEIQIRRRHPLRPGVPKLAAARTRQVGGVFSPELQQPKKRIPHPKGAGGSTR